MTVRALIVDDNAMFARAARGFLEDQGLTVTGVASNSAEALRYAEEHDPDVVLVDVDLGDESGIDLAERLNSDVGRRWPVVLVSAHDEADLKDFMTESSAIGFVSKSQLSANAILELLNGHDTDRRPRR